MADRAQRTEKPTGRRIERARRDGNVARSKELPAALTLGAFLLFARLAGPSWIAQLEDAMARSLRGLVLRDLDDATLIVMMHDLALVTGSLIFAPLGAIAVAGVAGNFIQDRPSFSFEPLRPKFSRISPTSGLSKLLRLRSWIEIPKLMLKMTLYTAVAVSAARDALAEGLVGGTGGAGVFYGIAAVSGRVIFRVVLLALMLAVLDWLFVRWDHVRQLRMTKQEIKDERREQEGDPMVKARVRSRQMTLARSRMMTDVAKATVVVTNPTHYAIALRYVPGEDEVPRLLAKGRGRIAQKIREVAAEHRVPVLSDPPLARALYRSVAVGGFIPPQLFRAVAELLALVLRRKPARSSAPDTDAQSDGGRQ